MRIGDTQAPRLPDVSLGSDQGLERAKRAAGKGDAQDTARQFETLFGVMLVRELRRSMPKSPFGEGPGADVYEGWFDQHIGGALGARDALGIAGMVKTALARKERAQAETEKLESAQNGTAPDEHGDSTKLAPARPQPIPLHRAESAPAHAPLHAPPAQPIPLHPAPLELAPLKQSFTRLRK